MYLALEDGPPWFPTRLHVPRRTRVQESERHSVLPTGLLPSLVGLSSAVRLPSVCLRRRLQSTVILPHNPHETTPVGLTFRRFRLFPVRSPLLRESHVVFVPAGTEMFQFSAFAPDSYEFTAW